MYWCMNLPNGKMPKRQREKAAPEFGDNATDFQLWHTRMVCLLAEPLVVQKC